MMSTLTRVIGAGRCLSTATATATATAVAATNFHAPRPASFDPSRPIAKTHVRWTDEGNFIGTDNDGRKVKISAGVGEGINPMNMLLMALGSCAAVDLVMILKKQRTELYSLDIAIDGQRSTVLPRPYEKAHIVFTVAGKGVTQDQIEKAMEMSMPKYCGVHGTLEDRVDISWEARVVPSTAN